MITLVVGQSVTLYVANPAGQQCRPLAWHIYSDCLTGVADDAGGTYTVTGTGAGQGSVVGLVQLVENPTSGLPCGTAASSLDVVVGGPAVLGVGVMPPAAATG